MRVHEVTFDGPRRHELRSVRVRWHDDGRVEIVFKQAKGAVDVDLTGSETRRPRFTVRRRRADP